MSAGTRQDGSIRVLVVDDHDLFRTGLASLLADENGIEVVAQASGGRMGVRLAAELNISPRTAKNHVSNILTKLGLPSRVQAAVYAVRQGVI